MAPETSEIRQLYLEQLAGNALAPAECQRLAAAAQDPAVKKMMKELDSIYAHPDFLSLLKTRSTSSRWEELAKKVMMNLEKQNRESLFSYGVIAAIFSALLLLSAILALVYCG